MQSTAINLTSEFNRVENKAVMQFGRNEFDVGTTFMNKVFGTVILCWEQSAHLDVYEQIVPVLPHGY